MSALETLKKDCVNVFWVLGTHESTPFDTQWYFFNKKKEKEKKIKLN